MMIRVLMLALFFALSACSTTPELQQQEPDKVEKAARINTQLGVAYMREGQLSHAAQKLEKALRQAPRLPDAHAAAAVLYERLGEDDKAERHHRRAVDLAPQDAAVLNNYGRFLCSRNQIDRALPYFERAADNPLYRTPEVPLGNAGLCLFQAGRQEQAEDYLLRALRANPNFTGALLPMAEIRLEAGDALSARGFYQRYLAAAPQNAKSLWLGIRIERLLGNRDAVASYSLLLRRKFPDSEEARNLLEAEAHDG